MILFIFCNSRHVWRKYRDRRNSGSSSSGLPGYRGVCSRDDTAESLHQPTGQILSAQDVSTYFSPSFAPFRNISKTSLKLNRLNFALRYDGLLRTHFHRGISSLEFERVEYSELFLGLELHIYESWGFFMWLMRYYACWNLRFGYFDVAEAVLRLN